MLIFRILCRMFAANKKPLIHLGREAAKPSWYHPHSSQRGENPARTPAPQRARIVYRSMLRPANGGLTGDTLQPIVDRSGRCSRDHSARSPAPACTLPARCCGRALAYFSRSLLMRFCVVRSEYSHASSRLSRACATPRRGAWRSAGPARHRRERAGRCARTRSSPMSGSL